MTAQKNTYSWLIVYLKLGLMNIYKQLYPINKVQNMYHISETGNIYGSLEKHLGYNRRRNEGPIRKYIGEVFHM
jgi:hypothetical protein